jgi:hypothetical protein
MNPVCYLISIILFPRPDRNAEVLVAVHNITGIGRCIYGYGYNNIYKELWLIHKPKSNRTEVEAKLQKVLSNYEVSVIALNNPVQEVELGPVRTFLYAFGWDLGSVSDQELSLYINSALQRQYKYYVDFKPEFNESGTVRIYIKKQEDHPDFTPHWLGDEEGLDEDEDEDEDGEMTIDDIETVHETIYVPISMEHKLQIPLPPSNEPPESERE